MFYSVLYERGKRENDQDSIALHRLRTRAGELVMALVCDGMGGEDCGEIASGYTAEELSRWFYDELPRLLQRGRARRTIERSLLRAVFRIHEELRQYGVQRGLRCGTTMTLLLLRGRSYLVCQLGDSMAYRLGRRCQALSERQGSEQGIRRCVGLGRYHAPQLRRGRAGAHTAFLLVSDGLLHGITPRDLGSVLPAARTGDARTAERGLRTLREAVLRRGGTDNMSAIYLRL